MRLACHRLILPGYFVACLQCSLPLGNLLARQAVLSDKKVAHGSFLHCFIRPGSFTDPPAPATAPAAPAPAPAPPLPEAARPAAARRPPAAAVAAAVEDGRGGAGAGYGRGEAEEEEEDSADDEQQVPALGGRGARDVACCWSGWGGSGWGGGAAGQPGRGLRLAGPAGPG
jgi:hypothetical protein